MIGGSLAMDAKPVLPLDRTLAPLAVAATCLVVVVLLWFTWRDKRAKRAAILVEAQKLCDDAKY